jgi:hypothetical protein
MTDLIPALLIATKTCDPPDPWPIRAKGKNDRLKSEEIGTFWLWAWPDLLGWPFQITWLFSPVTGKSKWPGDLWGLDDRGNLLIVETKLARNDRGPQDPFKDFIGFEESPRPISFRGSSTSFQMVALTQPGEGLHREKSLFSVQWQTQA